MIFQGSFQSLTFCDSDFVLRYKGFPDHWIGLSRQNPRQLRRAVRGEDFAFLNDQKVTSARSSGERHWICTKPQSRQP
uniref:Uncharacterized protein n=1 Tax=Anser cygnoides TaxID=8845 RepID=A0A8B9EDL5_ANSCY